MPVVGSSPSPVMREHERQVHADLQLVGDAVRAGELRRGHDLHDDRCAASVEHRIVGRAVDVVDRERVRQERDDRVERELLLVRDVGVRRP